MTVKIRVQANTQEEIPLMEQCEPDYDRMKYSANKFRIEHYDKTTSNKKLLWAGDGLDSNVS